MAEELISHIDTREKKPAARTGIVICECGDKIASVLDTDLLRERSASLPGVVYTMSEPYPCNIDGRSRIRQAIIDHKLERVLIAGCAPRLVEHLFQQTMEEAGPAGRYLSVVDVREHCAYVHASNPVAAMEKATNLIEMGVARLTEIRPAQTFSSDVVKSAMVIGSDLGALTVALALADGDIDVTLIERESQLGGTIYMLQEGAKDLIAENLDIVSKHPQIQTLLNTRVTEVTGQPGNYQVHLIQDDQNFELNVGAIILATGVRPKSLDPNSWYDHSLVVSQIQFAHELEEAINAHDELALHDVVMIFRTEDAEGRECSPLCCTAGIRQAIRTKQLNPDINVTILFRDLYLGEAGGPGENLLLQAKGLGVNFFRYHKHHPPVIGKNIVEVADPLTDQPLRIPCDRVVLTMPLVHQEDAIALAAMLHLPQDKRGFILERRIRLRPGDYVDDGIYVVGGAHYPTDTAETLLQAHIAAARALRFLGRDSLTSTGLLAEVDESLCTGCGNCSQICPTFAITLEKRDGLLSLATVDLLRCIGCGNCVVVCPVKAISLPGYGDPAILAQISAALSSPGLEKPKGVDQPVPKIVVLACEWSAYAAADIAGARRMSYPADVRIIRMNCSARFDPNHALWAFLNGADGVLVGICHKGECHYGNGNLYAEERVTKLKKQLAEHGVDPRRLRLEFFTADDGLAFANLMKIFSSLMRK
ncbi:MAG: hydrogenase iron-sulfur subunit [Anaerolineaceae bacterium]|nr:MAG: hydrogenase iron-sulfur subunit [Anaerolineaceae bacterium]